jgi:hypothetical protein
MLLNVIVNLHEGGFGAYVAASWAKSRLGLSIMHPVTIEQLNKPLPYDLMQEMKRLDELEHNTHVMLGVREGPLITVTDPESERVFLPKKLKPHFADHDSPTRHGKRASTKEDGEGGPPCKMAKMKLQGKLGGVHDPPIQHHNHAGVPSCPSLPPTAGCRWDATDWSCAYDSVFMVLFYAFNNASLHWRSRWLTSNSITQSLGQVFLAMCSVSAGLQDVQVYLMMATMHFVTCYQPIAQ